MRFHVTTPRLVPAALLASLMLAVVGTAVWAVGSAAAAETSTTCVAPTGTKISDAKRIAYLECQLKELQERVSRIEQTPTASPSPTPTPTPTAETTSTPTPTAEPTPTPTPTPAPAPAPAPSSEPILLGAGGGNIDRTKTGVDIDRWYGGAGDVDKAITKAKANHAAGVRTWLSFKLPYSWAQMASGTGDAWAKDLFTKLDALNFEVWVAFHHEPEGDGVMTDWRKMQDRLSRMVPGGTAGDIKFWLIVTGWHQENGTTASYKWDVIYPTGAPIYGIAYDYPYLQYGYAWENGVKTTTMDTNWVEGSVWADKLAARAKSYGVKAAVGEYGYSDEAFAKDKQWLDRFIDSAKANNLLAVSYFDTQLNSKRSWWLGPADSAKRAYFNSVMSR